MVELTKIILNKLTTRNLIVLIAITLVTTLGVIYAIDLAEKDHNRSFMMTFSAFNATDSTNPVGPRSGDFRLLGYNSLNYDAFSLFNDADSRLNLIFFRGESTVWVATLVDGYTDGKNFEFTWLVNHSMGSRNGSATSEIVVSGKCNVTETLLPGSNSTLTFTTITGGLVITPSTERSPIDGLWSNYSSVCQTVP